MVVRRYRTNDIHNIASRLFLLVSVGFNLLYLKRILWVRPIFQTTKKTDGLYLPAYGEECSAAKKNLFGGLQYC